MIEVIRVKHCLLWDRVLFRATCYEEVICDTFLGKKVFWMEEGECVSLKMSKKHMFEKGDYYEWLGSILTTNNQLNFSWDWVY